MGDTAIPYVTKRWDPVRGCSPSSPGCRNCFATRNAIRRAKPGQQCHGLVKSTSSGPKWTGEVKLIERDLDAPLRWRKPQRVAVCFGGDVFHPAVPDEWIARDLAWIRSLVAQGRAAGVPVYVKQVGARPIATAEPLPVPQSAESIMRHGEYDPEPIEFRFRHRAGADPAEWPEDVRVQEFPA